MDGPSETRERGAGVQFATKRDAAASSRSVDDRISSFADLRRCPATGPRAPVATGAHEVPVRRDGLVAGALPVAEQTGARTSPSGRARGTGRSGLSWRGATRTRRLRAPPGSTTRRRCRSLRAVGATRASVPSARGPSHAVRRPSSSTAERASSRTRARSAPAFAGRSRRRARRFSKNRTCRDSDRRFSKNRIVPRYFRSAATLRSRRSSSVSARCSTFALRGACVASLHRCRRGLCHETEREQANE